MLKLVLSLLLVSLAGLAASRAQDDSFDHSHAGLTEILAKHVDDQGLVDYAALKANPEQLLGYLGEIAFISEAEFDAWTRERQLALLINLYNAETLQLIVDHYPIKSIKMIGGAWDLPVVDLFGQRISLNELEHGRVRSYDEPRIHFALVCAALGCPPLRNEAFTADNLDSQLSDQTRKFLGTPFKNFVDEKSGSLNLSPIFSWYGGDFGETEADLVAAIKPDLPAEAAANLADSPKISYTFYDWALNEAGSVIPDKAPGWLQKWMLEGLQRISFLGPIREIAFVAAYVLCAIFLISVLLPTIAGGFLFGPFWGVVWVSLASTLGAAAAFVIGRYVARGPIERKFANNPKFQALNAATEKEGWKIVLLTRLSPFLPYIAVNYVFGLTRVRFWPYMLTSWIGMLPAGIAYVWLGSLAKNLTEVAAGEQPHWLKIGGAVLSIVMAFAVSIYITKFARKALAEYVPETESEPETEAA